MAKKSQNILPKMHLVCGNDDLRPAMSFVEIKNSIATATNAYVLVRYDLTDIIAEDVLKILDGKYIHRDFWQRMCKATESELILITIIDGIIQLPVLKYGSLSKLSYQPHSADFINYFPYMDVINYDDCMNEENQVPSIGINPKLLMLLDEVAKSNREQGHSLNLKFSGKHKAIIVDSDVNDRFLGLIMPCRMNDESKPISRLAV
jgi:hypothetical protein